MPDEKQVGPQERRISLKLIPAPDDPDLKDDDYQRGLANVEDALRSESDTVHASAFVQKSIVGGSWLAGDFVVIAQALGGAAFTMLGVWLKSKLGRRVKVRVGDIEAEASTPEELERLLERAGAIKKRIEESRKSE